MDNSFLEIFKMLGGMNGNQMSEFEFNENKKDYSNEEILRNKYDEFKGMDREELNNKLFEEVARQKQNGTFDYDALSKMIETLRGSLPENDYNNLKRILESLK